MVIEYPVPAGTVVKEEIREKGKVIGIVEWKFVKQYTHHALFKNKYGHRRCFTNAELYQRGLTVPKMKDFESVIEK